MTRVVVDADYLVYASGFAVEKTRYDVTIERSDGSCEECIASSKEHVRAIASDEPDSVVTVHKLVDAEPLQNALHLINRTLASIDSNLTQAGVEFDRLELFITGSGNFRNDVATIKPYKGNRDPDHKPFHYKSLRRFLVTRYGARVVDRCEADDAVAMVAHMEGYEPERLVIVSIDKDLRTIPGRHYHFKYKTMDLVTPAEAMTNFYRQLIAGDSTDNIGGVFRAGPKMAEGTIAGPMSESAMFDATFKLYESSLELKGCPYVKLGAEKALLENARLLHLLRYPAEIWVPPHVRDIVQDSRKGYGSG